MARTDENGRGLQVVLGYKLDRAVSAKDIYTALGVHRNTYHNRSEEDSFPNAEECRLLARAFDLNPLELQIEFGLISGDDLATFLGDASVKTRRSTVEQTLKKLSEMPRNRDIEPL